MGLKRGRRFLQISAFICGLLTLGATPGRAQVVQFSAHHREHERALPRTIAGGTAAMRARVAAGSGVSLVIADVDSDGTQDLISGYATSTGGALLLERGSPVALATTPHEWAMQAAGELVAPYVAKAEPLEVPVRPDLLKSADIAGHGFADLIFAQKGDSSLYLAFDDGHGSFTVGAPLPLAGRISSLATWRSLTGENLLVAGVCGAQGCGLQMLARDGATRAFVPTAGPVTAVERGNVDLSRQLDLAVIAAGKVYVLDGDTVLSGSPVLEALPVSHAVALALGTFVPDHHAGLQIAVLDQAATLHVITRQGIDSSYDPERRRAQQRATAARLASTPYTVPTPEPEAKRTGLPWVEAETVRNVGSGGNAMMFRARLSGGGNDDLAVMAGNQYITVAHPVVRENGQFKTTPIVTVDSSANTVAAAVPARISADARHGVVTLNAAGGVHPLTVTLPASNKTMTVNSVTDATPTSTTESACINGQSGCELRSALTVANLDRGANGEGRVDTINVSPGTYVLSALNTNSSGQTQNPDYLGSQNYHLEIEGSVNLVGAGSAITTINANQLDNVMAVDYGSFYSTMAGDFEPAPLDAFISGVTLKNGLSTTNPTTGSCGNPQGANYGYCNYFGGNLNWEVEGASNLVMNNVVITGGNASQAGGGGVYVSYDSSSSGVAGPLEIDHSTISSNQATKVNSEGGGGIDLSVENSSQYATPMVLTSDVIASNTSPSLGGGVYVEYTTGQITITNSTINSNLALYQQYQYNSIGGGFEVYAPLAMSGSTMANNVTGAFGGGGYVNAYTFPASITTSTFVNNMLTATLPSGSRPDTSDGSGLCLESGYNGSNGGSNVNATYSVTYSRFHGNTGGHATGLAVGCSSNASSSQATVTATDNWWGCNPSTAQNLAGSTTALAISGTGCDSAGMGNVTAGSLTVLPYTKLTLSLSSSTPPANTELTATASLGQNSSTMPTVFSAANDLAFLATPISTFTLSNTANVTYSPSATAFATSALYQNGTSMAVSTASAAAQNSGTATVTVDGQTLTANYTVTAPDLVISSSHTGNFKAGDAADTYSLTVSNVGTGPSAGTVDVSDAVPAGFTISSASGTGWTCSGSSFTCNRSDQLNASSSYPPVVYTVSVSSADAGTYTNTAYVAGGAETNTNNDTGTDPTIVVGPPTIAETFSPTSVAPNASSTLTFTVSNSSANAVSLTGVAFSDTFPSGLRVTTAAATNCTGGTANGALNATAVSLSGATIAAGATCTLTAGVQAVSSGSYPNTSSAVTATNSNAGGTTTATLTVAVTPTRVIFLSVPPSIITAGGNAGSIQAALEDASGNIATSNSTSQVTFSVTGPSGSGYSQVDGPYTVTNGTYTLNLSSVQLTVAGAYTYTITSSGLTSATVSETVNPGAAAFLQVSGLTTFTAPLQTQTATVRASDTYGNTATTFTGTVTLSSTDALATFAPTSYTYAAADAGTHGFLVTLGTAGTQSVVATGGSFTGSQTPIMVLDAVLVTSPGGSVSRLTDAGVATTSTSGFTGGGTPTAGAAIDFTGNIFSLNTTGNLLVEFSKLGTVLSGSGFAGGGLNAPTVLAVDGLGQVWIGNGNGTVSEFSNTGTAVSPAAGYPAGSAAATGVAIDTSGNVWTSTSSAVVEILGGAAPVNPLAIAVKTVTLGARP